MTFKKKTKQKNTRKKHKYRMNGGDDWYCKYHDTIKSTQSPTPTHKTTPKPISKPKSKSKKNTKGGYKSKKRSPTKKKKSKRKPMLVIF
jgi:hypothetical protein